MFRDLVKMLVRFVSPYKKNLFLNIFFNILSTILSLFSFAVIIPILQVLISTGLLRSRLTSTATRGRLCCWV